MTDKIRPYVKKSFTENATKALSITKNPKNSKKVLEWVAKINLTEGDSIETCVLELMEGVANNDIKKSRKAYMELLEKTDPNHELRLPAYNWLQAVQKITAEEQNRQRMQQVASEQSISVGYNKRPKKKKGAV